MNQITVDQLAILEEPTLIDVREPDEYTAGHVPGAVNHPLSELTGRIADVPNEGPVYVICQSGGRSAKATTLLIEHGIDAINIEGGTTAWSQHRHPLVTEQP
ncbi:rhodanese-like domain-containing protein [Subtercola vilae]|uniref:Rhodanese-like domain-containing protein n=1 Tax=Subtercola vilae TaxID=2056433 RepID=A0A4T2BXC7_9MICO|nr:rhodanese-like domain-containing protein [Subtercola vilae]TIH36160.1 rhodanese-like domain-containing protein [Subtercola vilae]